MIVISCDISIRYHGDARGIFVMKTVVNDFVASKVVRWRRDRWTGPVKCARLSPVNLLAY
jgi:hypothetical protein